MAHAHDEARWKLVLLLCAVCVIACGPRITRDDVRQIDARTPVLVIIEPSAIPRFDADDEIRPEHLARWSKELADRRFPTARERVQHVTTREGLADASAALAADLSGKYSKQRILRPPPDACVLRGAAPDVPSDCTELPLTLRVQVRAIRFTSAPSEVRMSRFIARAALVDVTHQRTLWTDQCELKSVDLPAVAGARTIPEINQMLERAAQRCANKLELSLQQALRRAPREQSPRQ